MSTVYHVHLSNTCIFCMLYHVSVGIIYVHVLCENKTSEKGVFTDDILHFICKIFENHTCLHHVN